MTKRQKQMFENKLTPEIYIALHECVAFKKYDYEDIMFALDHDLVDFTIQIDGETVGMVRLVGDGRIVFFVKDLIIHPKHHKEGLGDELMKAVFAYLKNNACEGAYVGLMSTKGTEPFYKKYGFIERPNNNLGSGMVMFYET